MPPLLRQQDFCPLHDLPRCHLEHLGKLEERPKGWAADASFQQADIGSIKAAIKRKLLLRDAYSLAKFPQGFPEGPFRAGVRVDLPPRLLSGPLRQQSNGDTLRTIFPRNMFRIMGERFRIFESSTESAGTVPCSSGIRITRRTPDLFFNDCWALGQPGHPLPVEHSRSWSVNTRRRKETSCRPL